VKIKLVGNKSPEIEESLLNCEFSGSIDICRHMPHRDALALLRRSHLLLLLLGGGEENGGVIPAKVFEYLYAGIPILALVPEGEAAGLVRRLGRGSVVTNGSPGAVASELRRWHWAWRRGDMWQAAGERTGLASYHRRELTSMLKKVLDYARENG
jgi:hypothetical protein